MSNLFSARELSNFTSYVEDLLLKSETLLEHLRREEERRFNRESYIEEIQRFLNERQTIIDRLQSFEPELKILIETNVSSEISKRLNEVEEEIKYRLQRIMNDIQKNRQLLRDKQRSRQKYKYPFANVERDGMFVDKRK